MSDAIAIPVFNKSSTASKEVTDHYYYTAYELNGVTYLPHYTKSTFVRPAYGSEYLRDNDKNAVMDAYHPNNREFTAEQLERAGAIKVKEHLWYRKAHKPL